ncbi:hypothetical protein JCGZ_06517 [Jatropha curcas]|uniref:Uncharacterized protein n=1 Tax=Jatropha curcas TaxID=180498 RepID=A0A067LQB7_JATCU|nr:hypothetical protein JCGZ_06517 [Jatropha curcas]
MREKRCYVYREEKRSQQLSLLLATPKQAGIRRSGERRGDGCVKKVWSAELKL